MNAGLVREFNNELRIIDTDRWIFGVGTRYLKDDSNLVTVDLAYRLTRRWTARAYERFDMQDGTWEEQEYTLRQETHDWYIDYGFRYLGRHEQAGLPTQKHEMTVFFSVTLKAFPNNILTVN